MNGSGVGPYISFSQTSYPISIPMEDTNERIAILSQRRGDQGDNETKAWSSPPSYIAKTATNTGNRKTVKNSEDCS